LRFAGAKSSTNSRGNDLSKLQLDVEADAIGELDAAGSTAPLNFTGATVDIGAASLLEVGDGSTVVGFDPSTKGIVLIQKILEVERASGIGVEKVLLKSHVWAGLSNV